MSEKRHYDGPRLARKSAVEGWGPTSPTASDAIQSTKPEMMTEYALLELVRRMNQAIKAWARDKDIDDSVADDGEATRPEYATKFPDAKIGDILYTCDDLDEQVDARIIVSKCDEGYVRTVYSGIEITENRAYLGWGDSSGSFNTPEEAARRQAEVDIEYHGKRYRRAQEVIAAIDDGKEFNHLLCDVDAGDEPEAD